MDTLEVLYEGTVMITANF